MTNMPSVEVIAIIVSVLALAGSNIALFLWARSESRNDLRNLDSKIDNLIKAIQDETKDFHGRLCGLEGKVK